MDLQGLGRIAPRLRETHLRTARPAKHLPQATAEPAAWALQSSGGFWGQINSAGPSVAHPEKRAGLRLPTTLLYLPQAAMKAPRGCTQDSTKQAFMKVL